MKHIAFAVIAAAGLGLWLVLGQLYGPKDETLRTVLAVGFAGGLGFMGAVDDLYDFGAKAKLGLNRPLPDLDLTQFREPPRPGGQLDLFG